MKFGIIDVGGGMRDAYGAGVFDWCNDNNVIFDYCIGVSAGSANLSSYLAGQRGRNLKFYTDYDLRDECMSMKNFAKTRNFVDLEYIYGEMSNSTGECPLDFEAVVRNPAEYKIVATDALSGKPYYFDKSDMAQDDYCAIKASSCVPAANQPYYVKGTRYFDGGISDPIPVAKCFADGCDKVVLILTRPRDFERSPKKDRLTAGILRASYPNAAVAMSKRAETYNYELRLAKKYEAEGKVLIIAPDDIGDMKTLTKDREMIEELYHKGYRDAEAIRAFVSEE
ncbi:MAG: patatin family protein [Mogibacterium sp.]|nr:patatin family protein [Mogibacterium sp.]